MERHREKYVRSEALKASITCVRSNGKSFNDTEKCVYAVNRKRFKDSEETFAHRQWKA